MRGQIIKKSGKKGNDSYYIVISCKDEKTGKYNKQWITFHGNKTQAEQELTRILRERDIGTYVVPGKITVAEFLQKWLKEYAKANLSPRTYEGYESIINIHLTPALGKFRLSQLKPEHVQKYYSDKLNSKCLNKDSLLSPRTVRRHAMCLHCALATAVNWRLLTLNPADAVNPPPDNQTEMNCLDEREIDMFLGAAKDTDYYALFYTALFTGMRRSELLALSWENVDILMCQISVTRSIHQLRDRSFVFRPTKSKKGRRLISLTPTNAQVLKEHREKQVTQRMVAGTTLKDDDLVFSKNDGSPMLPDTVSNMWRKLAKQAGLKKSHLHEARHSMASLMLKKGIHPAIVQQRLGHASIQITIDTYSHLLPGLQEAAAAKLDEWLAPKVENVKTAT